MCLLIRTVFSGERSGPWASCFVFFDTDYIKYWLGSIHTYSSREAPVIVALSHAEDNGADPKKVCLNEEFSWKVSFLYT